MDGQRQGWGRKRRRKSRNAEPRGAAPELIRIAARRPDSPRIGKAPARVLAASAAPRVRAVAAEVPEEAVELATPAPRPEVPRRAARIVSLGGGSADERERERQKLLGRLMQCEGRGAITRAADEFLGKGFTLPDEQEVYLQLLEHFDEARAREGIVAMTRLLEAELPKKRPVLDQRLRRLEEYADEASTRELAADLRRSLRT